MLYTDGVSTVVDVCSRGAHVHIPAMISKAFRCQILMLVVCRTLSNATRLRTPPPAGKFASQPLICCIVGPRNQQSAVALLCKVFIVNT